MKIISKSSEETIKIGRDIASYLKKGDIVAFTGELGSGKTTLIKGIVKALTDREATSPSFVLINEYPGQLPVFHFDLYRLSCKIEVDTIGWEEYIDKGIILIEWAERIIKVLPIEKTIFIHLAIQNGKRIITIKGLKINRRKKNDKQRKGIARAKSQDS
ncbi:MAG: tRNA (adenosine(37)-N6)-threonylcarbamoyltransferase complex ATPase subunit type 1 TsaE [Candidatus Ratteibacteria bacterium]|nr:tRNA (adenosine(37)-N6)-threonylcarbamoyltransferase complex ATPase subunit type 1 TsaE [Candidatus Ratteibacteria bacterium]